MRWTPLINTHDAAGREVPDQPPSLADPGALDRERRLANERWSVEAGVFNPTGMAARWPTGQPRLLRYDHDADPIGATGWLIVTAGYGVTATALPFSARPHVEAQFNRVRPERGAVDPVAMFGRSTFWSLSAGFRLFLGGDPMRMGPTASTIPRR
ncbi:MAG: hypothetical protein WEE89_13155 [Gemmatimonadota bacterium]